MKCNKMKSPVLTNTSSSLSSLSDDSERIYHVILFAVFGVILFLVYWLLSDPLWRLKFGVGDPAEVLTEECCRRLLEEEAAYKLERARQDIHRQKRTKERKFKKSARAASQEPKCKPKTRPKSCPRKSKSESEDETEGKPPVVTNSGWLSFLAKKEPPSEETSSNSEE